MSPLDAKYLLNSFNQVSSPEHFSAVHICLKVIRHMVYCYLLAIIHHFKEMQNLSTGGSLVPACH